MEQPLAGEIVCDGFAKQRTLRSFVQKRIKEWIRMKRPEAAPERTQFRVSFTREGVGRLIGCHLELRVGGEYWSGSYYTEGLHRAFLQSLQHLARAPA